MAEDQSMLMGSFQFWGCKGVNDRYARSDNHGPQPCLTIRNTNQLIHVFDLETVEPLIGNYGS